MWFSLIQIWIRRNMQSQNTEPFSSIEEIADAAESNTEEQWIEKYGENTLHLRKAYMSQVQDFLKKNPPNISHNMGLNLVMPRGGIIGTTAIIPPRPQPSRRAHAKHQETNTNPLRGVLISGSSPERMEEMATCADKSGSCPLWFSACTQNWGTIFEFADVESHPSLFLLSPSPSLQQSYALSG